MYHACQILTSIIEQVNICFDLMRSVRFFTFQNYMYENWGCMLILVTGHQPGHDIVTVLDQCDESSDDWVSSLQVAVLCVLTSRLRKSLWWLWCCCCCSCHHMTWNVEVDLPPELMKAVQCSHSLVTLVRWNAVQHSLQQSCQSVQSCSEWSVVVNTDL